MTDHTVELLFFDGCPNHEALERRLRALVANRFPQAELRLRRVESDDDAQRLRFLGSPSVRVDGRDVEPGADDRGDYGLKCRLYRTGDALAGAPPDAWIRSALGEQSDGLARLNGRSVINRLDDVSADARALHRRVLLGFARASPPRARDLDAWARELGIDVAEALAELERLDAIQCDPRSGDVVVAYPFSARETAHEVELLDDGSRVYAMCAIDALGIPFMLGRPVRIASRDPDTREPIALTIAPGAPLPVSEAVVRVRTVGDGRSCDCLCPYVEFLARRPASVDATILDLPAAIALGREIFGSLLDVTAAESFRASRAPSSNRA
jgi:hypothetical protein